MGGGNGWLVGWESRLVLRSTTGASNGVGWVDMGLNGIFDLYDVHESGDTILFRFLKHLQQTNQRTIRRDSY